MNEDKTREAILALVEDVRNIRSDIKGFEQRLNKDLNERFLQIGKYVLRFEERLKKDLDERFTKVDERFTKVDEHFTKVDERFTKIDEHFTKVDERFTKVQKVLDIHTQQLQNIARVVAGPMANAINKIEEHFNLEKTNFFPKNKKTKVKPNVSNL